MPTTKRYEKTVFTLSAKEVEKVIRDHVRSLQGGGVFANHGKARPDISYGCTYPSELAGYSFVIEEGQQ